MFGDIKKRKDHLMRRLGGVQKKLAHIATTGQMKLEEKLKYCWEEVLLHEEVMWFQKSKIQWLQYGDHNAKFFHLSTLNRRRRDYIEALQDEDGNWVFDQVTMKEMALAYYRDLYASNPAASGPFLRGAFPWLSDGRVSNLSRAFSKEKVCQALKHMGAWKAWFKWPSSSLLPTN